MPSLSEQTRRSPPVEEDQILAYTCTGHSVSGVSSMEELSRSNPSGDLPADVVINAFMVKNNTLGVSNVGRLGVLLARYTFFSDEVLQESTLKGMQKRPGLDPSIFDSLVLTIHNRHPFSAMSLEEFRMKIWPKIECSLLDFLKPKSKRLCDLVCSCM